MTSRKSLTSWKSATKPYFLLIRSKVIRLGCVEEEGPHLIFLLFSNIINLLGADSDSIAAMVKDTSVRLAACL
jgi:hypothetical protein